MTLQKKDWKDILGWSSDQIEDLKYVGYCYAKEGQYDTAITFFEALIIIEPKDPYCFQTLGAVYLETGKYLQALNAFERALKIEPHNDQTSLNKTKTLFLLGYLPQAIAAAKSLKGSKSLKIANGAEALLLAYGVVK